MANVFEESPSEGQLDAAAVDIAHLLTVDEEQVILVVPPAKVKSVEADLKKRREKFFLIGRIERSDSGKPRVHYSGSLRL